MFFVPKSHIQVIKVYFWGGNGRGVIHGVIAHHIESLFYNTISFFGFIFLLLMATIRAYAHHYLHIWSPTSTRMVAVNKLKAFV